MGTLKMNELSPEEYHEKLLDAVKAQVKAIMEESVTKKFVHEESEHVLRLCTTVKICLLDRLRKKTAGFLRSNTIANLFNKVAKSIPEVQQLVVKIEEAESAIESQAAREENKGQVQSMLNRQLKQIWVRLALTEKLLDRIVEYLVDNCNKYYEKNAMLSDPVRGRILSSLLFGPCALEYTKMKTSDHYWSDPPADELLQRHKLHCHNKSTSPFRRPTLQSTSKYASYDTNDKGNNGNNSGNAFREYVESLHQNSKSTLLYGKNNVVVQPREELNPIHGYLSLHQIVDALCMKWTPNQLMNVDEEKKSVNCNHEPNSNEEGKNCVKNVANLEKKSPGHTNKFLRLEYSKAPKNQLSYWEYAISVDVQDIVYLHCHQRNDAGGTLVLVGQDGVQSPPICFPPGGHLLSFLTCLETGLLPHGHLDPPLWSQHGKGKVFPRLRNRSSHSSCSSGSQSEAEEVTDFVFRVTTGKSVLYHEPVIEASPSHENLDAYSVGSGYSYYGSQDSEYSGKSASSRSTIQVLCDTMRRQLISRAFYGWLAHCRHLSTVRTHLSGLVLSDSCQLLDDSVQPIDKEIWESFLDDGKIKSESMLMKTVYFGGIEHSMRASIWPFLLNHYPVNSNEIDRENIDVENKVNYEQVVKEWKVVEKIIKRREKETLAAKLYTDSRESSVSSLDGPMKQYSLALRKQSTFSDVFASLEHESSTQPNPLTDVSEGANTNLEQRNENIQAKSIIQKRHMLKKGFRQPRSDTRRNSDHTPYSSISTEPSTMDRRLSSLTSLDTTTQGTEEVSRRDNILELDEDEHSSSEVQSSASDSDTKSSNRKTPPLKKQNGIDLENNINQSVTAKESEEQTDSTIEALPEDQETSITDTDYSNYTTELLDSFSLNLHRIEKDVHRCDRNHDYFTDGANLEKLRNIMCSYVWKNLDIGYMQGMCDLAAPLLVVMDDESQVYSCFTQLMKHMGSNFPNGGAMDSHFANMRSLIQVLDSELFEHMRRNGDYTHFYFCYRWFLLDFKRELSYEEDVFAVWERIWAARRVCSEQFVLFFALALLHNYRDIILDNEMDFTDIIKFFNEMAERHNATKILKLAQNFVYKVQSMISK
ncbi:small G protein signaling modulator 2-like [Styela clava]